MGKEDMPPPFEPFVQGAGAMLSCSPREPFKCASSSYKDILTITMTSTLRNPALQKDILQRLAAAGIPVTVETNGVDYESL